MQNFRLITGVFIASIVTSIVAGSATSYAYIRYYAPQMQENKKTLEMELQESRIGIHEGLSREESQVVDTVSITQDSVVSVIVTKDLPIIERYYENQRSPFDGFDFFFPGLGDDPFSSPFEFQVPKYREKGTEKKEVGGGTAFFISEDGLLLTNKHVVADEDAEYTVLLNDGTKMEAEVVARDPGNDIALLKVNSNDFPALRLAEGEPKLGQTAIAIGNSLGEFRNTVSTGVISGLKRSIDAGSGLGGATEHLESIIQTDAAINHGNSGGPLLNLEGKVIGMNTAIASGAQNVGFAIPAGDLMRAIESYKKHGKIIKAFLGIRYMPITDELKEKNNLKYDYGILIVRGEEPSDLAVVPGSPADKAGLVENDIVLEADGQKLDGTVSLARIIQRKSPGDKIRLKISSKGKENEIEVKLEEQE